jgi:hypothetical protein
MMKSLSVMIILALMIVFGPIFTIWSLNVVFGASIPLTLEVWFGVMWLHVLLVSRR